MYNKYLAEDAEAFSELYRPVEYEERASQEKAQSIKSPEKKKDSFDLRRLLHGIDIDKMGLLPIILLLLLLVDVEDDERLIIIALAVVFGI